MTKQDDNITQNSVNGTGVLTKVLRSAGLDRQALPGRHQATGPHYSEVASSGGSCHKRLKNSAKPKPIAKHHNLIFGSINTRTAKDPMKLVEITTQSKALKQQITFLQETHICGYHHFSYDDDLLRGWKIINSGFKGKSQGGVAIILCPEAQIDDIEVILEGRILLARVKINGVKLSALSVYSPTDVYSDS